MSSAYNHLIVPLMARKVPLSDIITTLPNVPEELLIEAYDNLIFETFDIDQAYGAAA